MTTETAYTILILLALSLATANCLWKAIQSIADFAYAWIDYYRANKPDPIHYGINLFLITAPFWGLIYYQWGLLVHIVFTLFCMMLYIVTTSISTLTKFGGVPKVSSLAQAYLNNQSPIILLFLGTFLFRVLFTYVVLLLK